VRSAQPASPKIALRFSYLFVCLLVCDFVCPTYHVHNNYVTLIVVMQLNFSQLRQLVLSTGVTTVNSVAQLQAGEPRSRGNINATMRGQSRVETPEVSSYS